MLGYYPEISYLSFSLTRQSHAGLRSVVMAFVLVLCAELPCSPNNDVAVTGSPAVSLGSRPWPASRSPRGGRRAAASAWSTDLLGLVDVDGRRNGGPGHDAGSAPRCCPRRLGHLGRDDPS